MIYRVSGKDRRTSEPREVYLDAPSAVEAEDTAYRRGIAAPKVDPVRLEDVPPGVPVIRRDRGPTPVPPEHSDLMTRPVWTIAKGVAMGLLLFLALIVVLQFVLMVLGMTLVGLFS